MKYDLQWLKDGEPMGTGEDPTGLTEDKVVEYLTKPGRAVSFTEDEVRQILKVVKPGVPQTLPSQSSSSMQLRISARE